MKKVVLVGMLLVFFALGAEAQEGADQMAEDEASEGASMTVQGVFRNALQSSNQIVVGDNIYSLRKTLMIDDKQRLAGQVMDELEEGERVQLLLSDERRDGYPVVRGIETNP